MTMQGLRHSNPLLSGRGAEDLEAITSRRRGRTFAPGEMLRLEGHVAGAALLVRRGRVATDVRRLTSGEHRVETIPNLDVGAGIAAPYRWSFDARAFDDVGVLAIEGTGLRTRALADAAFDVAISSRVATRLPHQLEDQRQGPVLQGATNDVR